MGNVTITKLFETETAHIVRNAVSQRCAQNIHGHSYKWEIHLTCDKLDEAGMVKDFGDLKFIKKFVDLFDHSMVLWAKEETTVKSFMKANFSRVLEMHQNPTAENMARLLVGYTRRYLRSIQRSDIQVAATVSETRTGKAYTSDSDENDTLAYYSVELYSDYAEALKHFGDHSDERCK